MNGFGLTTHSLVTLKRLLYIEGIGQNIGRPAWTQLEENGSAIPFDHSFCWVRENECIVGHMIASQDSKGRSHYPLATAVHSRFISNSEYIRSLLTETRQLSFSCLSADSRESVEQAQNQLQQLIATSPSPSNDLVEVTSLETPQEILEAAVDRLLHRKDSKAIHLRIPANSYDHAATALSWLHLIDQASRDKHPTLIIFPQTTNHFDLIIGEPTPELLSCLKADKEELPPYDNTPSDISDTRRFLARITSQNH